MIEIKEKHQCCGCYACYNICPQNAIKMEEDEKGFKYPVIDKQKCTNCGLCDKSCPILNNEEKKNLPKAYACFNHNEEVRKKSSSGGIFSLLAENIIEKNGVVFGAKLNENFKVIHTMITNKEEITELRGSKYVQSEIGDTYKAVKQNLKLGKYVLFTGTPCQIEGLKKFLGTEPEKLITQDIICHGVPSPKVWEKYLETKKTDNGNKVEKIFFRDKEKGWKNFSLSFKYKSRKIYKTLKEDSYLQLFLKNQILRDSCYNCSFKKKNRNSDITLADFWGIEKIEPELFDEKGVSLMIVNSEKGEKIFEEIKEKMFFKLTDLDNAIIYNEAMIKSCKLPKNNRKFWNDFNKGKSFEELTKKYTITPKESIIKKILRKMKNILMRLFKKEN